MHVLVDLKFIAFIDTFNAKGILASRTGVEPVSPP